MVNMALRELTNYSLRGHRGMTKLSILASVFAVLMSASSCYAATTQDAFQMGLSCMAADNQGQAIKFFSEALVKNPRHIKALLQRSQAYALTNQFPKAISDCDAVLTMDPKNAEAYFQRGLYLGFGNASGTQIFALISARPDLQKAARLTSDRQRKAEISELLRYHNTETAGQVHRLAALPQ